MNKANGSGALGEAPATRRRVLRVWVVDASAALRALFLQLLSQETGIQCRRQFPSAEAVLGTLSEERPPDIILLDVHLGGMNGLAAIRPIKKLAPTVKVLMLTMFSNSHYEEQAYRAGASGFLLKSYERDELVTLIREAYWNPDAPWLFPNMALLNQTRGKVNNATAAPASGPINMGGALRRLFVY